MERTTTTDAIRACIAALEMVCAGLESRPREHAEQRSQTGWEKYPPMLTIEQAAHGMNISKQRLRNDMQQPGFPVIRSGRSVRIDRAGMLAWYRERNTFVSQPTATVANATPNNVVRMRPRELQRKSKRRAAQ